MSFPSHVRRMLLYQARADVVPSVGAWTGGRLTCTVESGPINS